MSLPDDYLRYPMRRRGMDHDRYAYSSLFARKPVLWPGSARVALWIVPTLELFPLDMPIGNVKPAGALDRPYPDLWNYTLRDYGNRVGAARIFRALERRGLKASVAMSAGLVGCYPHLARECVRLGHEIVAHGLDMGHVHAGDLAENVEREWVMQALAKLRAASGQAVTGWYSPAHAETWATLDLVAEAGCAYVCDWANDDMPYRLNTASGKLHAMPHGFEVSDLQLFHVYRKTAGSYVRQVTDQFDQLYREAADHGGRIVTLSLRPWVSGVPHRIAAVEAVLDHILSRAGVWNATGVEILENWTAQQV